MKKILIVEDDKRITAALQIRLASSGYTVLTAHNGFDGLKLALAERPDLILMDIMMPVGMGFSVAERLKESTCAQVPIIFITASKRSCLRRTAEKLGAVGFFEKPYDAGELLGAVDLILGAGTPGALPPPPALMAVRTAV